MRNLKSGNVGLMGMVFVLSLNLAVSMAIAEKSSNVSKLVFTTPPVTIQGNMISDVIRIAALDNSNKIDITFNETATITTSSLSGEFSLNTETWVPINKVPLVKGEGKVYYRDSEQGVYTLSIVFKELSDSQTILVIK